MLHHWKLGSLLSESFKEHDEATIAALRGGPPAVKQVLRLTVRLAQMYKEPQLRKLLADARAAEHELNWAHFRQLMREGLTDAQRADLIPRIVENRWGYRELQVEIDGKLGGKKSKGGRKPGQTTYRTYNQAISALKLRSQAWLALEDDWLPQVKKLVAKLGDDEKITPEFVAMTNAAAAQLRSVAEKALQDAAAAEEIADAVHKAMGSPKLEPVEEAATRPVGARPRAKAQPKAKVGPRARLAKHPKMVDGKLVG